MSVVSAGETSPPTTEGLIIPTPSMDYSYLQQEKNQQSSIISANMLPSLPASTSSCCQPTTMSNSSSQIDLFVETPSTTMDSSVTMCGPSSNMYVNAGVLDLCGSGLEKLNRAAPDYVLNTTTLLLDDNCLQRLDNIHTYQCLEKVSYVHIISIHLMLKLCVCVYVSLQFSFRILLFWKICGICSATN